MKYMLGTKFVVALGILVCFVLAVGASTYWGTKRTQNFSQRSQFAHYKLEAYMALSVETYRHFKQLADILLLGEAADAQNAIATREALNEKLEHLKTITDIEVTVKEDEEARLVQREMRRLSSIADAIDRGLQSFDDIKTLERLGRQVAAWKELNNVLEEVIDGDFTRLIEEAIEDQNTRVGAIDRSAALVARNLTQTAAFASIVAVIFATTVGLVLFHSIKTPIDTMVQGTERFAQGDLAYRLQEKGNDEFAHLARSFNRMADDLEVKQTKLLEARTGLEQKVRERTEELQQRNAELRKLAESQRRLFADISHEFRTPLTIIRGEAEVTLRGPERSPEEYQTALQRIVELVGELARLVNDILLLARSESANLHLDLELFSIDTLLTSVAEDARALGQQKKIEIVMAMAAKDMQVYGDQQRLKQLLIIIIDNGCRYSQPGSKLTIASNRDSDGGNAIISVRDEGIGITDEDLNRIFERFYRSEQARRLVPGGTGLGLPVAKAIAEAHGGTLAIESELAVGTTVTIKLPLAEQTEHQDENLAS